MFIPCEIDIDINGYNDIDINGYKMFLDGTHCEKCKSYRL